MRIEYRINQYGLDYAVWPKYIDLLKKLFLRLKLLPHDTLSLKDNEISFYHHQNNILRLVRQEKPGRKREFHFESLELDDLNQIYIVKVILIITKRFFHEDISIQAEADFSSWIETAKKIEGLVNLTLGNVIAEDLLANDNGKITAMKLEKAALEEKKQRIERARVRSEIKEYIMTPEDEEKLKIEIEKLEAHLKQEAEDQKAVEKYLEEEKRAEEERREERKKKKEEKNRRFDELKRQEEEMKKKWQKKPKEEGN